jgi:PTH1 family peptidyl-tRNA hydrolase
MTVCGLGNPGDRYADTRHNVGFMVADTLARRLGLRFRHRAGRDVARGPFAGGVLKLVKPLLWMNESGIPVREQLAAEPDDLMVVCDDIWLPFGRLRLRPAGSDGGHKGLASIIYRLETDRFARLRFGVGSPPPEMDSADYVLARFAPDERQDLPGLVDRAADACLCAVEDGLERAMNRYNPAPGEAE